MSSSANIYTPPHTLLASEQKRGGHTIAIYCILKVARLKADSSCGTHVNHRIKTYYCEFYVYRRIYVHHGSINVDHQIEIPLNVKIN